MTFYSQSEMFNNCEDQSKTKVYLNPNFNRPSVSNQLNKAVMHVNPRFPHLLTSVQPNSKNSRIHVNPNFMKSKGSHDDNVQVTITNIDYTQQKAATFNSSCLPEQPKMQKQIVAPPITKSRYTLVRQNATKPIEAPVLEKPKTTVQVNKYKSIPLNDIKRNLDNVKNSLNKRPAVISCNEPKYAILNNKKYIDCHSTSNASNKFKLVNYNNAAVVRNKSKTKTLAVLSNKKTVFNLSKMKKVKGSLKKNNIPCPMFRKFGKCLRKNQGRCEFLHDKKHVSICRKFIKGLCHDVECLLSHDLTTKKMPTCYFYLQGTCTKPDCPYLHVKLNEKVKICPDFLKGYCEKGSKCLLRHILTKKIKDSVALETSLVLKKKYIKFKSNNSKVEVKTTQISKNSTLTEKNENVECRYYQENKSDVDATETCKIIKPTRCKLGTLPSFIQL